MINGKLAERILSPVSPQAGDGRSEGKGDGCQV